MKKFISLFLTLAMLFAFAACGEKAPLENERPRDKTGFEPEEFNWNVPKKGEPTDHGRFIAGKWVRDDGFAVLYIDFDDSRREFDFELFVLSEKDEKDYTRLGTAQIDGNNASFSNRDGDQWLYFTSEKRGVIEITAYIPFDFASPDGTFYITRAKYTETPTPRIERSDDDDDGNVPVPPPDVMGPGDDFGDTPSDIGNPFDPGDTTSDGGDTPSDGGDTADGGDTPADVPAEPGTITLEQLIAEYKRTASTTTQTVGIRDDIAFWQGQVGNTGGFFTHDITSGTTTRIGSNNSYLYFQKFYNSNIYLVEYSANTEWQYRIVIYNLKGTFLRSANNYSTGSDFFINQNGTILSYGQEIVDNRSGNQGWYLISANLQTVTALPSLTVNIGHGETAERLISSVLLVHDNKAYVKYNNVGENYVIDLTTMKATEITFDLPSNLNHVAGKYFFYNNGRNIINIETGETFDNNPAFFDNVHYNFAGEGFYRTTDNKNLSKLVNGEWEVVFPAPNTGTVFTVLSKDYLIVRDSVGTFLYKFSDTQNPVRKIEF